MPRAQPRPLYRPARPRREHPTRRRNDPPPAVRDPRTPHQDRPTLDAASARALVLADGLHRSAHPHPSAPRSLNRPPTTPPQPPPAGAAHNPLSSPARTHIATPGAHDQPQRRQRRPQLAPPRPLRAKAAQRPSRTVDRGLRLVRGHGGAYERLQGLVVDLVALVQPAGGAIETEVEEAPWSSNAAPLAKVTFTRFLYVSPVQRIPSWYQVGTRLHFHSSTTSGSACFTSSRMRASTSPRQLPNFFDRVDQLRRRTHMLAGFRPVGMLRPVAAPGRAAARRGVHAPTVPPAAPRAPSRRSARE